MNQKAISFGLIGVGVILMVIGLVSVISSGSEPDVASAPATTFLATAAPDGPSPEATTNSAPAIGPTAADAATTTTVPATTTVAPTTTAAPTTTSTVPPETPEEFLQLFLAGLRADPEFLVSRLNKATINIYGAEQCLEAFSQVLDPDQELTVREVGVPEAWDYVIDDIVTPIDEALPVEVERFVSGETRIQELHWKLVDGLWTWFSDCGDPLAT